MFSSFQMSLCFSAHQNSLFLCTAGTPPTGSWLHTTSYKTLIKMGAEIIVSPSAWSVLSTNNPNDTADFINCWRAFNITRAAENLVCFVTSNLVGSGNAYLYSIGNSMIVNPEGKILYNAQNNECAHCQSVDLELIRRLKKEYPIYNLD